MYIVDGVLPVFARNPYFPKTKSTPLWSQWELFVIENTV